MFKSCNLTCSNISAITSISQKLKAFNKAAHFTMYKYSIILKIPGNRSNKIKYISLLCNEAATEK